MSAHEAPEPTELETRFVASLPLVEQAVQAVGRRHGLDDDDLEDFGSWFKARVIASGYALFAKFRGDASLSTFLSAVVVNAFRDYRNSRWGRFRVSAASKRKGAIAVQLETLVRRDGLPIQEAVARIADRDPTAGEEARRLASGIPVRPRPREVELAAADPGGAAVLPEFWKSEDEAARQALAHAVVDRLRQLPADDRLIITMRFWDGVTVAEIARALCLDQKRLYRRIEGIQHRLQRELVEAGIDREAVRLVFGQSAA